MPPKRKALRVDEGAEEEVSDTAVFAGVPLAELGKRWLAMRGDIKQLTEQASDLRKSMKNLENAMVERMVDEGLESVTVEDEVLVRAKGISIQKS